MATKKERDGIIKMIKECYNEETGEMSPEQEQGTYQEGLIDALQTLTYGKE